MQNFYARWNSWGIIRWRSLSWAEFKKFEQLVNYTSPMGVSNEIYRAVLISGPNPEDLTAGVIEYIVRHVFSQNAFSGKPELIETKLNNKRKELLSDYLISAKAIVASTFHYSFEEIDTWDEDLFLERLAQAEFIAGKELPVGFPSDEKEDTKQNKKTEPPDRKKKELTKSQQMVMERTGRR